MLSDESSSDSETGRFKCQTNKDNDSSTNRKDENSRSVGRNRNTDERFSREIGRRRDNRDRFERRSRERTFNRYNRYSPVRRRHSRDRSRERRKESDRYRSHRSSKERTKVKDRSLSRERRRKSRSRSYKSPIVSRNIKDEIKNIALHEDTVSVKPEKVVSRDTSLSPTHVIKRSEIYKPTQESNKRKSDSPIPVEEDNYDHDEVVQPGSYYSMIPAVIKDKSEESTEIDSSDDEKLRAKLLNLERELHKSKKKKHKKKHKRKSAKLNKDNGDATAVVEVSSTTDIQEVNAQKTQSTEVSSTQKNNQKDSSEEGEILSEDDVNIDPNDLRHKLKRSKTDSQEKLPPKLDACGPALPPHLQKRFQKSPSPGDDNPVEPEKTKNIGPTIPSDLRKVLAERSPVLIKGESSDEDPGIGPLPTGTEDKWTDAHQKLEERAYELKIKQLDGHTLHGKDTKSREQWMLELPEGKTKFLGLEARGFRAKEGPDMSDRSEWTDTPEEKARKAAGIQKEEDASEALQREAKERLISNRDKEQEQAVRKHKKKHKRDESLLEMHQKKLKKKKKKEEDEKKERRPFSRDVDLQVNRFDEAQKKSIIKKAQDLNSRFSSGEAKFL